MAFTSSYTPGLIQQSEYYYGTPDVSLTGSFTGSFSGDGSQLTGIISASYALTASHALNGGGSVPAGTVSGSAQITALGFVTSSATASFITNSQTGSFITNSQTASFVTNSQTSSMSVLSSSFALTASHALNAGGGSGFPFNGDAVITGSLVVSASAASQSLSVIGSGSTQFDVIGSVGTLFSVDDSLTGTIFSVNDISGFPVLQAEADGDVYLGKSPQSLYTTAVISSNTANITQSIHGISTSSYAGAFIEYTAFSGSHDARAGSLMAIWSGSAVNFTETTTTDFGNTSNLLMQVAISQSQAQVQSYSTTAGYKIKTIIKAI